MLPIFCWRDLFQVFTHTHTHTHTHSLSPSTFLRSLSSYFKPCKDVASARKQTCSFKKPKDFFFWVFLFATLHVPGPDGPNASCLMQLLRPQCVAVWCSVLQWIIVDNSLHPKYGLVCRISGLLSRIPNPWVRLGWRGNNSGRPLLPSHEFGTYLILLLSLCSCFWSKNIRRGCGVHRSTLPNLKHKSSFPAFSPCSFFWFTFFRRRCSVYRRWVYGLDLLAWARACRARAPDPR